MSNSPLSRRQFVLAGTWGVIGTAGGTAGVLGGLNLAAIGEAAADGTAAPVSSGSKPETSSNPIDSGRVESGKVFLPQEKAPTDASEGEPPAPLPPGERTGFAVVGLGRLALDQILPAFAQSTKTRLVALVSGTPDKAALVGKQYGIEASNIFTYDQFDTIKDHPEIKAVYIVLPNALHAEFTLRAAQAGKHVLCEKPMATGVAEAERMVDGCARSGVKLMIAYRCQYEKYNRALISAVSNQTYGPIGLIETNNFQHQADLGQWRLKKALSGGGSLPDVGLYCLNSSRAVLKEEPTEVFASIWSPPGDPRFDQVESTVSFLLKFPSGAIANCACSYNLRQARNLRVFGPQGSADLENAFDYHGQELTWNHQEGPVSLKARQIIEPKNQFALELDHFASCIVENRRPHTPGEEGLQDHRIMEAIYQSARTGLPVPLTPPASATRGPDPVSA